ncbi:MAG: hypothetical protein AAGF98_10445 [Cyanobacteria bacterium P01_H01_bin.153]
MNISASKNRIHVVLSSGGAKNPLGYPLTMLSLFLAIGIAKLIGREELFTGLFLTIAIGVWSFLLLEVIEIVFFPESLFISRQFLCFSYRKRELSVTHLNRILVTRRKLSFYRGFDPVKRELFLEGDFGKMRLGSLTESETVRLEKNIRNWFYWQKIQLCARIKIALL